MCGLVGLAGEVSLKEVKAFNELLIIDQIRGPHSTGVAGVDRDHQIEVFKQIGATNELMEYKRYDQIVRQGRVALIGHNRWATQGKINKWNAHPFVFDDVVGAHNGTVHKHIIRKLPDSDLFDTDSEAIMYSIQQQGIDDTVKHLTDGAYCLTYYDGRDNTMNFLRNKERPLYYAVSKNKKTVFWASEILMLMLVASRQDLDLDAPVFLPVDTLTSFKLPVKWGDELDAPFCKEVKPPPPAPVLVRETNAWKSRSFHGYTGNYASTGLYDWDIEEQWYDDYDAKKGGVTDDKVVPFQAAIKSEAAKSPAEGKPYGAVQAKVVVEGLGPTKLKSYKAPWGDLEREEFDKITADGCKYCTSDIQWGDKALPYTNDGYRGLLCEVCSRDEDIVTMIGAN